MNFLLDFLQPGVAVLTFALLVLGLVIYFARVRIQGDISIQLRNLMRSMREMDQTIKRLVEASKSYNIEDPEPYGEITRQLSDRLVDLQLEIKSTSLNYSNLRSNFEQLQRVHWVLNIINLLDWIKLRVRVLDLGDEIINLQSQMPPLESLVAQLDGLTWAVARDASNLISSVRTSLSNLRDLSEKGLSGAKYDGMVETLSQWENTFDSRIPVFFLSEDRSFVESQSSREFVSSTYKFIKNMSLVTNEIKQNIAICSSAYATIQDERAICAQIISDTERIISTLENHPVHPVRWDISRASFQQLVLELSREKQDQSYTVESLLEHSQSLENLRKKIEQTKDKCLSTQGQFNDFLEIVDEITELESLNWAKKAITYLERAKKFDPVNWVKQTSPTYVEDRLRSLISLQAKNIPRRIEGVLLESHLPGLLSNLQTIRDETIELKPIFQNFFQRLREIEEISLLSQENLGKSLSGLNQALAVAASNTILQRDIGSEIDKLLSQTHQLQDSLKNTAKDPVHSKAKKVDEQLQKNHQAMVRWSMKLLQHIENKKQQLSSDLNVLQDLVTLGDPVFMDAINLIHESRTDEDGENVSESLSQLTEMELANFLRKESALWERWVAAESAIREIAGPVLESHNKFNKIRLQTQASISQADLVIPENQEWPPTTQRLSVERLKFKELEQKSENLRREKNKAIILVGKISDLTVQYQELNGQVTRILDLAKQEQGKISELEKRLQESKNMWNKRANEHRANNSINSQIAELLSGAESDLMEIKSRYKKGILQYQQAYQALRLICRNIDEAVIPIGNHVSIDITGERHREI